MSAATPRGRLLRLAPGYNPNSSSLGVDVSFLLFGTAAVTAMTLVTATALRLWRPLPPARESRAEGEPAAAPALAPVAGAAPSAPAGVEVAQRRHGEP